VRVKKKGRRRRRKKERKKEKKPETLNKEHKLQYKFIIQS
jgi:hypothetical protein